MKKVSIVSLVLMSVLVLGMLVSCQPEPEVIEKEVVKEVTITKEYFPAPATVTVNNPDPSDSTKIKVNWTIVPNTQSYTIYLKNINSGNIYFIQTIVPNDFSYNAGNLCVSIIKNISGNSFDDSLHIVGVRATSIDGANSSVKWNR